MTHIALCFLFGAEAAAVLCVQQPDGAGARAAVASTVATRNDEELRELFSSNTDIDLSFFSNSTASQFLSHFWSHGTLQARRPGPERSARGSCASQGVVTARSHSAAARRGWPAAVLWAVYVWGGVVLQQPNFVMCCAGWEDARAALADPARPFHVPAGLPALWRVPPLAHQRETAWLWHRVPGTHATLAHMRGLLLGAHCGNAASRDGRSAAQPPAGGALRRARARAAQAAC